MLSADEMAQFRATQELTMTDSAEIQRPTVALDGMGGTTKTWVAIGTIKCRIAVNVGALSSTGGANSLSGTLAGQIVEKAPWRVTFPALTDVRTSDRLVVGSKRLEVVGISGPSTYETARISICVDV